MCGIYVPRRSFYLKQLNLKFKPSHERSSNIIENDFNSLIDSFIITPYLFKALKGLMKTLCVREIKDAERHVDVEISDAPLGPLEGYTKF